MIYNHDASWSCMIIMHHHDASWSCIIMIYHDPLWAPHDPLWAPHDPLWAPQIWPGGTPQAEKKVLRDAGTQRPEKGVDWQEKKVRKNIKIELNGVARPRFGPILSGNAAGDSPMLLVASELPKTLKNPRKTSWFSASRGDPLITLSGCGCKNQKITEILWHDAAG